MFFENDTCLACRHALGFQPHGLSMGALGSGDRRCRNYEREQVCNWVLEPGDSGPYCRSCRLNRIIPDLSSSQNRLRWYRLEVAKRRLLFTLLEFGLATDGMSFEFLLPWGDSKVTTGHADGLITINAEEADDAWREKMREDMNEPYRTLLGHFRHESGHYYWSALVEHTPQVEKFRQVFGDERASYQEALDRHYQEGAPANWQEKGFVSSYATMHPSEDWAETWAHYLHMHDTLQTARQFNFSTPVASFADMTHEWGRLTFAVNSINRSMGLSDLYPFVLTPKVMEKLELVHNLLTAGRSPLA